MLFSFRYSEKKPQTRCAMAPAKLAEVTSKKSFEKYLLEHHDIASVTATQLIHRRVRSKFLLCPEFVSSRPQLHPSSH